MSDGDSYSDSFEDEEEVVETQEQETVIPNSVIVADDLLSSVPSKRELLRAQLKEMEKKMKRVSSDTTIEESKPIIDIIQASPTPATSSNVDEEIPQEEKTITTVYDTQLTINDNDSNEDDNDQHVDKIIDDNIHQQENEIIISIPQQDPSVSLSDQSNTQVEDEQPADSEEQVEEQYEQYKQQEQKHIYDHITEPSNVHVPVSVDVDEPNSTATDDSESVQEDNESEEELQKEPKPRQKPPKPVRSQHITRQQSQTSQQEQQQQDPTLVVQTMNMHRLKKNNRLSNGSCTPSPAITNRIIDSPKQSSESQHIKQLKFLLQNERKKVHTMKHQLNEKDEIISTLRIEKEQLSSEMNRVIEDNKDTEDSLTVSLNETTEALAKANNQIDIYKNELIENTMVHKKIQEELSLQLSNYEIKLNDKIEEYEILNHSYNDLLINYEDQKETIRKETEIILNDKDMITNNIINDHNNLKEKYDNLKRKHEEACSKMGLLQDDIREWNKRGEEADNRYKELVDTKQSLKRIKERFSCAIMFITHLQETKHKYQFMLKRLCIKTFALHLYERLRMKQMNKILLNMCKTMLVYGIYHAPSAKVEHYRYEQIIISNESSKEINNLLEYYYYNNKNMLLVKELANDLIPIGKFWKRKAHEFRSSNEKLRTENALLKSKKDHNNERIDQTKVQYKNIKRELEILRKSIIHVQLDTNKQSQQSTSIVPTTPKKDQSSSYTKQHKRRIRPATAQIRRRNPSSSSSSSSSQSNNNQNHNTITEANIIVRSSIGMSRTIRDKEQQIDYLNTELKTLKDAIYTSKLELINKTMPRMLLEDIKKENDDDNHNNNENNYVDRDEQKDYIIDDDNNNNQNNNKTTTVIVVDKEQQQQKNNNDNNESTLTKFFLWESPKEGTENPHDPLPKRTEAITRIYEGKQIIKTEKKHVNRKKQRQYVSRSDRMNAKHKYKHKQQEQQWMHSDSDEDELFSYLN